MDLTDTTWRKSTRSAGNGGACVELAALPDTIAVRDSKNPDGPMLTFDRNAMRTFITDLKR